MHIKDVFDLLQQHADRQSAHNEKVVEALNELKIQTKITNGRVTKLEGDIKRLDSETRVARFFSANPKMVAPTIVGFLLIGIVLSSGLVLGVLKIFMT